jgi:L-fucose isomerase-like protein
VLQVTFADAGMVLELARHVDCPLVLWGYPEERWGGRPRLNALCGINLAAHALRRAGHPYRFLYADPGDRNAVQRVLEQGSDARSPAFEQEVAIEPEDRLAASSALKSLSGCRMGLVGEHPDGFETCRFDREDLARRFGMAVEPISLSTLFDTAGAVEANDVEPVRARAMRELEGLTSVDAEATEKSLRLYAALRSIGARQSIGAFAVRCWPEMFTEYGCAVCGALGMLNEDAIPCACEADVVGNVTNLMLQAMAGTPPWVVDLVHADVEDDTAVIWHCGLAPRSMASPATPPRADIHANRKLPLLQAFALKPGRVTVARLSQASNGLVMVIAGGEMIDRPMSFSGTSGVLRFDAPVMSVVDDLLSFGLEHHVSIAYGDHRGALRAAAQQIGIPVLSLT